MSFVLFMYKMWLVLTMQRKMLRSFAIQIIVNGAYKKLINTVVTYNKIQYYKTHFESG